MNVDVPGMYARDLVTLIKSKSNQCPSGSCPSCGQALTVEGRMLIYYNLLCPCAHTSSFHNLPMNLSALAFSLLLNEP